MRLRVGVVSSPFSAHAVGTLAGTSEASQERAERERQMSQ
jgi:hypothetical protein